MRPVVSETGYWRCQCCGTAKPQNLFYSDLLCKVCHVKELRAERRKVYITFDPNCKDLVAHRFACIESYYALCENLLKTKGLTFDSSCEDADAVLEGYGIPAFGLEKIDTSCHSRDRLSVGLKFTRSMRGGLHVMDFDRKLDSCEFDTNFEQYRGKLSA